MRCQRVGANVSPIAGKLSSVVMLFKPALLSYRCAAQRRGATPGEPVRLPPSAAIFLSRNTTSKGLGEEVQDDVVRADEPWRCYRTPPRY
jgi:hypothetical protein